MGKRRRDNDTHEDKAGVRVSRRELHGLRREAGRVNLAAPVAAAASLAGPYISTCKGRGMEFDEVRVYQPGDEVRNIDWHVTARTGRVHSKLFSEERERPVLIALDTSTSMHFGTRIRFKVVAAARAAAVIAWSGVDAGDRVGGLTTAPGAALFPPRHGQHHLAALFDAFSLASSPQSPAADATAASHGSLAVALGRLRRRAEPGSRIFVISDFYESSEQARTHLGALARSCDVTCILVSDALEEAPPPPGRYRFSDGTITTTQTAGARWRAAYVEHFVRRRAEIDAHCRRHRSTLLPLRTDDDPAKLLARSEATTVRRTTTRGPRK